MTNTGVAGAAGAAPPTRTTLFGVGDIALILGSFIVTRLALAAIGMFALSTVTPEGATINPNYLIVQWDSYWYLSIVNQGYNTTEVGVPGATNYAFYPLYPALIWLLSAVTGLAPHLSGALISNACFIGALFVLFALCLRWSNDRNVARFAVVLLCLIPEGFVFSAVYTESLFILLTMASVLLFEKKQHFLAGICAGLSAAVRSNGVFVIVFFGLSIIRERGFRGAFMFWREPERYLPIIMAPIGLFVFWWICMITVGDAFAQKSTLIRGWPWSADWPWANIVRHLTSGDPRDVFLIVTCLMMFGASLTLLDRKNWPLFGYCLANFLLYLSSTLSNSLLRYSVVLFPIYYGVALYLAHRRIAGPAVLVVLALAELYLMGHWALGSTLVL